MPTYETLLEYEKIPVKKGQSIIVRVMKISAGSRHLPAEFRMDIRLWLDTERFTGFTKKGIQLPLDKIDAIISSLKVAKKDIGEHQGDQLWQVKMK